MNFARGNPVFAEIVEQRMATRNPPSPFVRSILETFRTTNDISSLDRCTFRYIAMYKRENLWSERLEIALGDFGYTMSQLDSSSLYQIIEEILSRQ